MHVDFVPIDSQFLRLNGDQLLRRLRETGWTIQKMALEISLSPDIHRTAALREYLADAMGGPSKLVENWLAGGMTEAGEPEADFDQVGQDVRDAVGAALPNWPVKGGGRAGGFAGVSVVRGSCLQLPAQHSLPNLRHVQAELRFATLRLM